MPLTLAELGQLNEYIWTDFNHSHWSINKKTCVRQRNVWLGDAAIGIDNSK